MLEQLKTTFEKEKTMSDEVLESLFFIYKQPLLDALSQIDKSEQLAQSRPKGATTTAGTDDEQPVTLLTGEGGLTRKLYKVKGSMGINHYLFEGLNFCTCPSFKYEVLVNSSFLYCKHIIMVKLCLAMNKLSVRKLKENKLVEMLKQVQ